MMEYLVRSFPESKIEDIENAVNVLAAQGWRVVAAGSYFNAHVVYFERAQVAGG